MVKCNFYKKIDSTLRGNVGVEIFALLDILDKDAAIVAPAYIDEGRSTIGAYQLLNGLPIERTQCALDPKAPIYESYIPLILTKDITNPQVSSLISTIFKFLSLANFKRAFLCLDKVSCSPILFSNSSSALDFLRYIQILSIKDILLLK